MRILLVEDDELLGVGINDTLTRARHAVEWVRSGTQALAALQDSEFDLVVLDLGLPGMDGLEVLRRSRAGGSLTPVLVLSARDAPAQRVAGLDAGADDYLVKPFSFSELLARIRALLRRPVLRAGDRLVTGDIAMDLGARTVTRSTQPVTLTPREYAVLEFLLRHPGQALSRTQIAEGVWSWEFHGESNVVDVYIGYLRRKLDTDGVPSIIETLRGYGYRLRNEGHRA